MAAAETGSSPPLGGAPPGVPQTGVNPRDPAAQGSTAEDDEAGLRVAALASASKAKAIAQATTSSQEEQEEERLRQL